MQVLPTTPDEARRLATLAEFDILDTPTEALFDALTRLAATICETPISLITLVDAERQWFKSNVGLPNVTETPRKIAFCDHTIRGSKIMEVPDALADPRFADNPLVTGEPGIRFYAGAPLRTHDGHALGTICVIDRRARTLTPAQLRALDELGRSVVDQLEARRRINRERDAASERVAVLSAALGVTADPVAIAVLGPTPDDAPTIVYANDAYVTLKRAASATELVGATSDRFLGPLTDRSTLHRLRETVTRGEPFQGDYISYRLDGSHYYVSMSAYPLIDERGTTTHMVMIQRDVSELVLRDASLAMQNERLTALTSIARGLFAALDPRALVDALIVGTRELIGAEARLLVALPEGGFGVAADLLDAEKHVAENDPVLEEASGSSVPWISDDERRSVVRVAGGFGETRYLLDAYAAEPLHTADVFALGLLAQYFAVAARNVELYGELQARRAAVVELNQVKNDLIAMLAHDFKGPLTTIVGFADVLAEDDRFDDESRKFLAMISSSAMRLASLATDTLALSRLEQNELTLNIDQFDLVALVRDIVRVFSVTRRIDLTANPGELIVGGDAARLRQVFENLIGNAIKYSPNGEPVDVRLRSKGRGVEITVRDRGIGIPSGDLPKLFGRFARAQNARAMGIGGTGFGLYLTKTILEMHGGSIAVETVEGAGSTFRVFVPASVSVKRPQHRRFILLDPAGDARSYLAHTLRDDGCSALVVADGDEVLAQVDETQFDAALIDTERVGMPLDEFVRRIAGRTALIRIDPAAVADLPGWDGSLVKPFLAKDLRATLDAAIVRHPRRKPEAVLTFTSVDT